MRRFGILLFIVLLLAAAFFALSPRLPSPLLQLRQRFAGVASDRGQSQRVREVHYRGKVPHRRNPAVPAWAREPERQRQLNQVFAIGGKLGRDSYFFLRPSDVDIDAQGRVYVVDRGHRSLRMFAADGSFVRSLRYDPRNNPYFLSPRKVAVSPEGEIYVWDEDRGIVSFDAAGRFRRRISVPYEVADLVVNSRGRLILLAPSEPLMLHEIAPDGSELLAFGEHSEADSALWSVFGLGTLALASADTVCYSAAYPYRITIFDPSGRPVRSFERDLGVVITPPTITRDATGRIRAVTRQQISFGVGIGGDGFVYNLVRTRASLGADRIDVFSFQGEYLQVFYLPIAAVAFSMRGMRMVLLQAPPNQRVISYEVTSLGLRGRALPGSESSYLKGGIHDLEAHYESPASAGR